MKKRMKLLVLGSLVLSLSIPMGFAFADVGDSQVGFGRNNITDGRYASTLTEEDFVTVEGDITNVNATTPPYRLSLKLDSDKLVNVSLGRIVFTDEFKDMNFKDGNKVEVKGFYRTFDINNTEETVLVPSIIKLGDKELKLRDESNRPIWSGGKGRNSQGLGRGQGRNQGQGFRGNGVCPTVK